MKTIQNLSLILILFQIKPITGAINCTCHYVHPQAYYCLSETVVLGYYVHSITHNTHLFNAQYRLKPEPQMTEFGNITVHTPTGCGFPYNTTTELIILFGNLEGRRLSSLVCAKEQEWKSIPKIQKYGFFKAYKPGCRCFVNVHGDKKFQNVCLGQNAYLRPNGKKCEWFYGNNDLCEIHLNKTMKKV